MKNTLIALFVSALIYSAIGFTMWDMNAARWTVETRSACAVLMILLPIAVLAAIEAVEDKNKKVDQ